jgi:peptide/nickel transport system permease protein
MIARSLPITLKLGFGALCLALALSLPLGILSAIRPNTWIDRGCLSVAAFGQAMPTFFLGFILILIFGVKLRVMPISGSDSWVHFIMPALTLATFSMPPIMRLARNGMIDALEADYIRTARAKGLGAARVVLKHALRNASLPVVSIAAVQLGQMLAGSIIVEAVFALNGIGYLAWESIERNDFPVVQSIVLVVAAFYIILTFMADLLNAFLDPRIRGH